MKIRGEKKSKWNHIISRHPMHSTSTYYYYYCMGMFAARQKYLTVHLQIVMVYAVQISFNNWLPIFSRIIWEGLGFVITKNGNEMRIKIVWSVIIHLTIHFWAKRQFLERSTIWRSIFHHFTLFRKIPPRTSDVAFLSNKWPGWQIK